ncbi:hypothetical protein [Alkaliphilus transvaalensis]|uniref:hypothetical protein n=1 Tax=Alkaliphilus transvaalensis TaxID=114628 RepID=UPI00047E95EC|nr:hypothetical protein [Alkaliphilus transvaalensis]
MDQRKISELIEAAKKGDLSKLEEVKNYVSEEDYQKALQLFNQYAGRSEAEIMQELARLKKTVPNQQEIIDKIQPFLNEEQKAKLRKVLEVLDQE